MRSLFDHPLVHQSSVLRKGAAFAVRPISVFQTAFVNAGDYEIHPPVFANSVPKSGTHLLLQITREMPETRYRGRFIATSPSLTQKERSPRQLSRKIKTVLPGETLGSHLYYSTEVEAALTDINALHLFIYRDPRDVIVSEAFYLAEMNRWHRMHKHFSKCSGDAARLALALDGIDESYPECNARLLPYSGWLASDRTVAIRYEDIAGVNQAWEIERIVGAYRATHKDTPDDLVKSLCAAVRPEKSHTFRRGGSGGWKRGLSKEAAAMVTKRLRPALDAFGYET
jgi:sulfotransferase family protein